MITVPAAQWTVPGDQSVRMVAATIFRNAAGQWIATDTPSDAVGHTIGYITLVSGHLVIDDTLTSGFRTIIRTSFPQALLVFS